MEYSVGGIRYRVSHGSFFQTSRPLTETLVKVVTEGESGEVAWTSTPGSGCFRFRRRAASKRSTPSNRRRLPSRT